MRYLLVINTSDVETAWNALRFGSATLSRSHEVSVLLLGSAVGRGEHRRRAVRRQALLVRFDELGGVALSCGTCLRIRRVDAAALCPMSTMDDLVRPTEEADRVLSFG